jgi:tetratricopeptide (TPR) repeat protein
MFFTRIRRHAKWMFVFLALVFGLGFVGFGVGAGGVGVGDIFRDASGGEAASVSDARKETEKNPNDVQAWRDLSLALQSEGETAEAITALNTAAAIDAKDPDLYRELAALQLTLATEKQREAQNAQLRASFAAAGQNLPGRLTSPDGRSVFEEPIGRAINAEAAEKANALLAEASAAATDAIASYKRVVKLTPGDPNVQIELASTAEQAGDYTTAVAAYEKFLKLAPDDAQAPIVKQQVQQLKKALAASSG